MTVIDEVAAERQRRIDSEGYTASHDDEHVKGEILLAAICYAAPDQIYIQDKRASCVIFKDPWPWDLSYDKRRYDGNVVMPNWKMGRSRRRELLVKAAAMIVAEIDRIDREIAAG
jgi:hypothetical protein